MEPTRVTTTEFQNAFSSLSHKARHEPLIITEHGKDSLVVMSADEWLRLRRRARQAGATENLPAEWIEAVRHAEVAAEFSYLDAELS